MFRQNNNVQGKRGNGEWLAYGISGLIVFIATPFLWRVSETLFYAVIAPQMGDVRLLAFGAFALVMAIAFYGLVVMLMLTPRLVLFKIIKGKLRK